MCAKKSRKLPANDTAPGLPGPSGKRLSPEVYARGVWSGDRILLGKAITLIESRLVADQALARQVVDLCLPHRVAARRIGVSGAPGVGKSTFIEALGRHILQRDGKLAVLAIDPSSRISGGSILGDKTRMNDLVRDDRVFIRPSPAGDTLGGVAAKTRETILLCEAAGFTHILVETVGVGQSETAVQSMVDCFLLLLLPGAGDELQGIKRGIVEMADILVVNKADGNSLSLAGKAKAAYSNALHLFPPKSNGWTPGVYLASAQTGTGIPEVWQAIEAFFEKITRSGYLEENRKAQSLFWFRESLDTLLREKLMRFPAVQERLPALEASVVAGAKSPLAAAEELLTLIYGG